MEIRKQIKCSFSVIGKEGAISDETALFKNILSLGDDVCNMP